MFAEFEHKIHQIEEAGEPLTPNRMNESMRSLISNTSEMLLKQMKILVKNGHVYHTSI